MLTCITHPPPCPTPTLNTYPQMIEFIRQQHSQQKPAAQQ